MAYYTQHAEAFLAPLKLAPASGEAQVESSPVGVLLGVEPWNFPYYQLARFVAPNLMAGNVVMVKHAGCVSQCAIAFEKLPTEAGAPAGCYTNLFIDYEQVNRIIDDPRIKGVALTGSVDAGKVVAARAGHNLKKSTMELGGSDAFIVLDDADLDKSVTWAVWAKMNNTGQCCIRQALHRGRVAGRPLSGQVPDRAVAAEGRRPDGCGNHAGAVVDRGRAGQVAGPGGPRGGRGGTLGDG